MKKIQTSPAESIYHEDPPEDGTGLTTMPPDPVWRRFHSMVEVYSKRKLTKEDDKLPAISALAETFASHIQSDYLAGLWKRYLVYDLMWWVDSHATQLAEK
jgi:hypothetical protein